MIPKVAPVPVAQFSASYVARCIEYHGHTDQRVYWGALKKEWKRVVQVRAFWLLDSISTYQQRAALADSGTGYWWLTRYPDQPWDRDCVFATGWGRSHDNQQAFTTEKGPEPR